MEHLWCSVASAFLLVRAALFERRCAMLMGIILWIVLGLVAGFLASKVVNGRGEGVPMDILLGIVGAMTGGWLFNAFGSAGVTGFNLWSLLVAVVGAVLLLVIWHAIRGGVSRDDPWRVC
jgi:uncharacterized membrane protein YeaQ/YmgE (transglycosylase-associated protein family)